MLWDVQSYYSEQVPERDDEEDDEGDSMNTATLERLTKSDERTKRMTKEEYMHYSECRQASFTYRKGKRFAEWAGFGVVTNSKPNDDIVDVLGFLLYDLVQTLTEEALNVKAEADVFKMKTGEADAQSKKRRREPGLFDLPDEGRSPVDVRHVQEAYRRLQEKSPLGGKKPWLGPKNAPRKTELQLVSLFRCIRHWGFSRFLFI